MRCEGSDFRQLQIYLCRARKKCLINMDKKTWLLSILSLTDEEDMIYYMRLRPFVWL